MGSRPEALTAGIMPLTNPTMPRIKQWLRRAFPER